MFWQKNFLRQMSFLPQPSPFIRAWDRHQETQECASDGWVKNAYCYLKKYLQIEKKVSFYSIGEKKFYQYLYGQKFLLVTDSKTLVLIFLPNKQFSVLKTQRFQRYAFVLKACQFDIKYSISLPSFMAMLMNFLGSLPKPIEILITLKV